MCNAGRCVVALAPAGADAPLSAWNGSVYFVTSYSSTNTSLVMVPAAGGSTTVLGTQSGLPSALTLDGTHAYWSLYLTGTSSASSTVYATPLAGGGTVPLGSISNTTIGALAVSGSYVYWETAQGTSTDKLWRVPISGGAPTGLASTPFGTQGLAADATSVYWTQDNGVWKLPIGGGTPSAVAMISNGGVGSLALLGGAIYYTVGGVQRVSINGGASTPVVSSDVGSWLIVTDGVYVYWTDTTTPAYLKATAISGGPVMTIASEQYIGSIAIDSQNIYWVAKNAVMKTAKY